MRTIESLAEQALKFWPPALSEQEKSLSIIPRLIETQDKFISLLNISDASPTAWKDTLDSSNALSANLFLKHLAVISDVGGEKLMRFRKEADQFFINGQMEFVWQGEVYNYTFKSLEKSSNWSNSALSIDGKSLGKEQSINAAIEDVCMLLMFGGLSTLDNLPDFITEKCIIGAMLGKDDELASFVKQRYIWVSRITGGATSNSLGHLGQKYVKEFLEKQLDGWRINQDKLDVSQNERTNLSVDIVAKSPQGVMCAIEVSFQVTTNSVIERKAGQAQARQKLLHENGHYIAYVIDGAGNLARDSALKTIFQYSDCIVSFKDEQLAELVDFLKSLEEE